MKASVLSGDDRKRYGALREKATEIQSSLDGVLADIDRALVARGVREEGQTVDPTRPCIWTPTGRDGHGKVFVTCTTHGETKVVPE